MQANNIKCIQKIVTAIQKSTLLIIGIQILYKKKKPNENKIKNKSLEYKNG